MCKHRDLFQIYEVLEKFLKERLDRVLHLITENYKVSDGYKKGPKGLFLTIEKEK